MRGREGGLGEAREEERMGEGRMRGRGMDGWGRGKYTIFWIR